MTSLPAVVTIPDLPIGTTLSGNEVIEAVQTASGVGLSIQVPLSQVAALGTTTAILPPGGIGGQFLQKTGATSYVANWVNLSSAVLASTGGGLTVVGSTTLNLALNTAAPLSVLGVAGTATAVPLPIVAVGSAQLLQTNAGGTGLFFGPFSTTLLPGPFQTSTLPLNQALIGNATSPIFGSGVATAAWPLVGNGTAVAPSFQQLNLASAGLTGVLGVPSGGSGTTTHTLNQVLIGSGTSAVIVSGVGTTSWPLVGNGTALAPTFAQLATSGLANGVTGTGAFALQNSPVMGPVTASTLALGGPPIAGNVLSIWANGIAIFQAINTAAVGAGSGAGIIGATNGTPTAADQRLGFFNAGYNDGTTASNSVGWGGFSSQSWTVGSAQGSYFDIQTTANGTSVRLSALRVHGSKGASLGTTADPAAGNFINTGFHQVGSGTGLVSGGTTAFGFFMSTIANLGFICGTGTPTVIAATGTLYINNSAANATARLYINTNGSTGWANFTASA